MEIFKSAMGQNGITFLKGGFCCLKGFYPALVEWSTSIPLLASYYVRMPGLRRSLPTGPYRLPALGNSFLGWTKHMTVACRHSDCLIFGE